MAGDTVGARVKTFTHGNGFGTVVLEDGRELPFDVSVCVAEPEPDTDVQVRVGTSRHGSPKVVYLEPVVADAPERRLLPIRQALGRIRALGIASELDEAKLGELVAELYGGDEGEADLVPVLAAFYQAAPEAAVRDGFFTCDWRFANDTDDLCADLSARIGGEPLLRFERWTERITTESGFSETVSTLHARGADGSSIELDVRSVLDVIDLANRLLEAGGSPRRFVALETDGDWYAFFLFDDATACALSQGRVLPIGV